MLMVTLITTSVVVVTVIGYLSAIAWALHDASRNVAAQAAKLERAAQVTIPLGEKLTTLTDALVALAGTVHAVDGHLTEATRVLRR